MTATIRARRAHLAHLAGVTAAVSLGPLLAFVVVVASSRRPRDAALLLVAGLLVVAGCLNASHAIGATVGAFVFSALVRRLVPAADPSVDPVAIVPFLVALPLAARGLGAAVPGSVALLLGWVTLRGAVSLGAPLVALVGWVNFAVPVLAAQGVRRIPGGVRTLARATVICGGVAATYGVAQYFVPFPWDAAWLDRVYFLSVGELGKPNFHPFGTLPAPGTAAILNGVVILLVLARRDVLGLSPLVRLWALVSSTTMLLLTQVRSGWIALVVALVVGAVAGKLSFRHLVAVVCAAVGVVLVLGPTRDLVVARARTLWDVESDVSYRHRLFLLTQAGELVTPLGRGLGTRSAASRVQAYNTLDNGYVVVAAELGVVGFGLLLWALGATARRSVRGEAPFFAYLVVINLAAFAFGGFPGFLLWSLCGGERGAQARAGPPAPSSESGDETGPSRAAVEVR